jgi:hypothetical protein
MALPTEERFDFRLEVRARHLPECAFQIFSSMKSRMSSTKSVNSVRRAGAIAQVKGAQLKEMS